MKIVLKARACGKTHRLIKECHRKGGYMVCMDIVEANRVFHLAKKMKMDIPLPITFAEFINGQYYSSGVEKFYIDNADLLLQGISSVPIHVVSFNKEGK